MSQPDIEETQQENTTMESMENIETENKKSKFNNIRDSCADTFTPKQIKTLSHAGKQNMGWYGFIAILFLVFLAVFTVYGLILEDLGAFGILVTTFNLIISMFIMETKIAGVLHILFKKFK
jgi:hypothetical protein